MVSATQTHNTPKKSYVLLSGGIDSTTCLAMEIAAQGQDKVGAFTISYGQRHDKEVKAAWAVADYFGIPCKHIELAPGTLGEGGLTDSSLEIPSKDYSELPYGESPTYVPFRNGTLLSIAASHAYVDPKCRYLLIGIHKDDAENWAYADCTSKFFQAMRTAVRVGTYERINLHAPLIQMDKTQVITRGEEAGAPWHLTWSCYEGRDIHCGVCPTCRSRRKAFIAAGIEDPTVYAEDI